MLNGVAIDPAGTYRVTVNSFLADGGDVDLDALVKYFEAFSPIPRGPRNRITLVP